MTVTTKSPTANSGDWADPANAYSSNNQYASTSTNNAVHRYQTYGFSLGSDETITKVEVGIEFYCAAAENVQIRVSWDGGTTWSDWSNKFTLTSEDIIWVDVTSATAWTPEKLNDSNLRVEIIFGKSAGAGCFAPDTLITMADGSQKPITEIELGDKVLTHDGVGTVTAKTVHRSLNNYRLVQFKNVQMFPTHAVREGDEWHGLPSGLKLVFRKHIVNIETDKKSFFANGVLVHNIEKAAWTAYLDWIPVRVTHSIKGFSDSGAGSDSFVNPYRAMDFSEIGAGSESFGIPFKALGFSELGTGVDVFSVLFKAMQFSDSGHGADSFAKAITLLSKAFLDSGLGTDVFSILFKALKFSDSGSGTDVFATPYRTMGFSDTAHGLDIFKLLRELAFLDSALGTDAFAKTLLGVILKGFSDNGLGVDVFEKVWFWLPWVQRTYQNVFKRVKVDLEAKTGIKEVVLGEPLKLSNLPVAIINPLTTRIAEIAVGSEFENTIAFAVLLLIRENEPSNWFTDIVSVMADVIDALLADHTLNGIVEDVAPTSFEPGKFKIMQKLYYGGLVKFEAKLCYAA